MTYSIVYSSKTGNTKMLADALHQALPADDCLYSARQTRRRSPPSASTSASGPIKAAATQKPPPFSPSSRARRSSFSAPVDLAAASRILSRSSRACAISCRKAYSSSAAISAQQNAPERPRSLRAHRRRRARQAQPHAEDDLQFRLRPQPSRRQRPAGPHRRSGKLSEK